MGCDKDAAAKTWRRDAPGVNPAPSLNSHVGSLLRFLTWHMRRQVSCRLSTSSSHLARHPRYFASFFISFTSVLPYSCLPAPSWQPQAINFLAFFTWHCNYLLLAGQALFHQHQSSFTENLPNSVLCSQYSTDCLETWNVLDTYILLDARICAIVYKNVGCTKLILECIYSHCVANNLSFQLGVTLQFL